MNRAWCGISRGVMGLCPLLVITEDEAPIRDFHHEEALRWRLGLATGFPSAPIFPEHRNIQPAGILP